MKIQLIIDGVCSDNKDTNLELSKNCKDDSPIFLKIGYQDIQLKLEDLEKAIKYLKVNINEKI